MHAVVCGFSSLARSDQPLGFYSTHVSPSCYLAIAPEGDLWLPWPISYQPQLRVSVVQWEELLGKQLAPRKSERNKYEYRTKATYEVK